MFLFQQHFHLIHVLSFPNLVLTDLFLNSDPLYSKKEYSHVYVAYLSVPSQVPQNKKKNVNIRLYLAEIMLESLSPQEILNCEVFLFTLHTYTFISSSLCLGEQFINCTKSHGMVRSYIPLSGMD